MTAGGLRKSYSAGRGRSAAKVIAALEKYRYKDVSGKREVYAHPAGHMCRVKRDGSWSHSGASGHVMSGKGADSLRRLLGSIHGEK